MNARCAGALDSAPGSFEKHVPGFCMAVFEVIMYGRFWQLSAFGITPRPRGVAVLLAPEFFPDADTAEIERHVDELAAVVRERLELIYLIESAHQMN